ncbi:MAG: radical SAM protein [Nanoarchaeota archaeon]|nr:radical SAM protein [Nanoarchaeota archaeon]MBU1030873.1 radical SAM protein [Nanoarchaeota archaeon]MBU1849756.1 radical SAM protein [Nanoarchaeota archaeon]
MTDRDKIIFVYATPACGMSCGFCYSKVRVSKYNLSEEEIVDLVSRSKKYAFNAIGLTGGDPFGRKDIASLVEHLSSLSVKIRIDSNLLSYDLVKVKPIIKNLDLLGVPLDGPDAKIHDYNRDANGHFQLIYDNLLNIRTNFPDLKIKIHTVLTKRNIDKIYDMQRLIEEILPNSWSIYKFFPAGVGYENKKYFEISNEEFATFKKDFPNKIGRTIIDIPEDDVHDKSFLMVGSDGIVYGCFDEKKLQYQDFGRFDQNGIENALAYYDEAKMFALADKEIGLKQ